MHCAVLRCVLLQTPPQVKYRLPSDPSVWVDVVDDEDVQARVSDAA